MSTTRDWARDQLKRAGYDAPGTGRASIANSVDLLLKELDEQGQTEETRILVAELFYRLASGYAIAPRETQDVGASWTPVYLGDVQIGTTVRVREDAYDGVQGQKHNGMVGKLVAARGGFAVVQYAESTEGTGHRHNPALLEALVKS